MEHLINEKLKLHQAVSEFGSPVNIINFEEFFNNVSLFKEIFKSFDISGEVYFARKANKAKGLVIAARDGNFGVDTASGNELKDCIESGLGSEKIICTAAVKNEELFSLAATNNVCVIIDNLDEMHLAQKIANEKQVILPIGIRISGFKSNSEILYSRFGFPCKEVATLIKDIPQNFPNLVFKGLHFHLNGYSISERGDALQQSIALASQLQEMNINVEFIDIGGGFLMNYLQSKNEWFDFFNILKESILDNNKDEITFRKDSLGMVAHQGKLIGEPKVYPYYNELPAHEILRQLLNMHDNYNNLRNLNIQLRLEPGRSLLAQSGITVAKVAFRKYDMEGRLLIGLEMNRTQMKSSSEDFLLDPFHISQNNKVESEENLEAYLVGAYCLEQELILKRKIPLRSMPEIGDLFVFVNTAGYMMHFYESQAHCFDLAQNVILQNQGFILDSVYFEMNKPKVC